MTGYRFALKLAPARGDVQITVFADVKKFAGVASAG
jgi:hypothetical protein